MAENIKQKMLELQKRASERKANLSAIKDEKSVNDENKFFSYLKESVYTQIARN